MKKTLMRRKWTVALLLILVIVLAPYFWSRLNSSRLRIQTFKISNETKKEVSLPIRVACYNIAHGRGLAESNWDGGSADTRLKRLDDIADLLKELDADVVVLNEVDFDTSWSNHVNQAEYLARKAGYPFGVEERNLDFRVVHRTWRFGNAILSRYPISKPRVVDLPSFTTWETMCAGKKRGVACDVQFGEHTFSIYGLHLSHRSEDVRELSAKAVIQLAQRSDHPCVIMGDMNSTPEGLPQSSQTKDGRNAIGSFDESGILKRFHAETPVPQSELTFRADNPKSIIDWILISNSLAFQSYKVESSDLSDHRPVVAEIGFASIDDE